MEINSVIMTIPTVVYEDSHILVINKPAGLTVNKSDTTTHETTLQDWVETYLGLPLISEEERKIFDSYNSEDMFKQRAGIVHRIDKETSGILLIAKNIESFVDLQRQFKERIVKKEYRALAHGVITPSSGEITVPIGRLPWNRKRFGVVAGGREAYTSYQLLDYFSDNRQTEKYSYLQLFPKTGRTHQIRVHLKYLQHPIVADSLYSGRKTARNSREKLSRLFLHAYTISFLHPKSHTNTTFISPLPRELDEFLQQLAKINTV